MKLKSLTALALSTVLLFSRLRRPGAKRNHL